MSGGPKKPSAQVVRSEPPPSHQGRIQIASWNGPLPPAQFLRDYEDAFPGAGERILKSFELEGEHRREQDREGAAQSRIMVSAHAFVMRFGAISTSVVALAGFIVAGILASHGQYVPAAAIGGGEVLGLTILGLVRKPKKLPQQAASDE